MEKSIFVCLILVSIVKCNAIKVQEEPDEMMIPENKALFSLDDEFNSEGFNRGLIISSIVKKSLKNIIKQMPCGWPEYGIPPLAPYRKEELILQAKNNFVSTLSKLTRLRIDGLDDIKIKKLSISYMYKKVKFHFIFRTIKLTSKLNTDTLLNLMTELGITVRYEGKGNIDFSLLNLSIKGSFKYKAPLIWGSVQVYKFQIAVTLGDCKSNFTGIAPTANINRFINNEIEKTVLSSINNNQAKISSTIEEVVVATINESLKGKNIWDVIAMKPPKPDGKCIPPPDPWA